MVCKYCQAELEEGVGFCPECGKPVEEETVKPEESRLPEENTEAVQPESTAEEICTAEETEATEEVEATEETEAAEEVEADEEAAPEDEAAKAEKAEKQEKLFVRITAIVTCAVLLLSILGGVWTAFGGSLRKNSLEGNASYEVSSGDAEKKADVMVARIGKTELSNSMLQMFYWDQIYNFVSKYYNYLSYLGLDFSKPLSEQLTAEGDVSWEQYFLEGSLDTWHQYQALALKAQAENYVLPASLEDFLQTLPETVLAAAQSNKVATADEMVQADDGPGTDLKLYEEYMRLYYTAISYFDSLYASMEITDAELETYYATNAEKIKTNYGVDKQTGKLVDVRHILLTPEGGVTDDAGNTTYSEKEWEACREKAQALLDQFLAGEATEDNFAQLATQFTVDPGSKQTGGLYEYVYKGQMVPEFDAWCFDDARKEGDTGLVRTSYGYHIMYYIEGGEGWIRYCSDGIRSERGAVLLQQILDAYPMEVYYNRIALGQIELNK